MTVIAWDGKTLAADKAATWVGFQNTVTKIYRVPGGLVGLCGDSDRALELLAWFRAGRDVGAWPRDGQNRDDRGAAVFIDEAGRCFSYEKTPYPQHNEQAFYAIGSGRDYALAAMHLGHDARKAVEVACALDNCCGRGIDTLTLYTKKRQPARAAGGNARAAALTPQRRRDIAAKAAATRWKSRP